MDFMAIHSHKPQHIIYHWKRFNKFYNFGLYINYWFIPNFHEKSTQTLEFQKKFQKNSFCNVPLTSVWGYIVGSVLMSSTTFVHTSTTGS